MVSQRTRDMMEDYEAHWLRLGRAGVDDLLSLELLGGPRCEIGGIKGKMSHCLVAHSPFEANRPSSFNLRLLTARPYNLSPAVEACSE